MNKKNIKETIIKILVSPTNNCTYRGQQKNPYIRQVIFLKKIWSGTHQDFGLERLMRFLCCLFQFISLSTFIRYIAGKRSFICKKITIDFYVVLLILFPIIVLATKTYNNIAITFLMSYLIADTVIYNLNYIFLSDLIPSSASYTRNLIGVFCNYIFILLAFAIFYMNIDCSISCTENIMSPMQAIYYSITIQSTLGFGDIHPNSNLGYIVVVAQTLISLLFVGVFFSITISKLKEETFLNKKNKKQ